MRVTIIAVNTRLHKKGKIGNKTKAQLKSVHIVKS